MKIHPEYIRGLVDGEGSFTFSTSGPAGRRKVRIPTFALRMHYRDKDLIASVAETLGLRNRVYIFKSWDGDGYNRAPQAALVVREFGSLKNVIIPFFYEGLVGYKRKQFLEWLEKIGTDPDVPKSYKLLYRLHKSNFYSKTRFMVKH